MGALRSRSSQQVRRPRVPNAIWLALVLVALAGVMTVVTDAQTRRGARQPAVTQGKSETPAPVPQPPAQPTPQQPSQPAVSLPPERVEADVSTRSVSITSSYTGTEIVVFGTIEHSRQTSPESGYYDVVVVLEGTPSELVARRKSNVAGIWVNTQSLTFASVPSYYAIASTRPLDEIASQNVLSQSDIGFAAVRMTPVQGWETGLTTADLDDFRQAVIRVKRRDGLYKQEDYDVIFIGRSLFRATINLPAHVPVGPLVARVHVFREGGLLTSYSSRVTLERQGLERFLHDFAYGRPTWYGIMTVLLAIAAGLAASAAFTRIRT